VLTYRLSVRFFSQPVAVVATLIWLQLDRGDFGKANVDMGLTLYILCSLIVLYEWIYTDRSKRLLFMASFFLGIAIGTKYQALMFLPLIGVVIIFLEPRPSYLLISAFGLLVPCGYWYIRNYLITGDPFDPFGAKIFGFYDWNAQDYAAQFKDLQHQAGWPRLEFGRHC
jgi:4-amino-4-deoxy-L-arabinose transferase-like glycosyltransferase